MKILCVEKMELGPIATNAFLLWEENGDGNAVLIDAPPFARDSVEEVLERQKIKLKSIWLTHGHWDHMGGVADFDTNELEIIGHRNDQIMFEQPGIMSTFAIPGLELKPVQITRWVEHGDNLDLWGRKVEVRHCPGHCPGNVVFWVKEAQRCFVGDVIFAGSVGRSDLPGGDFSTLENSILDSIYTLPDETLLHPGHGEDTEVGREKISNPFVQY
ncbi:MAG: MBL fold metallo-hydrolase [Opitutae bacterium]|nr:MBL fold metallo-hydrolase [Opitutae bacterium]MEC8419700.1 MBL fold metallo-hydrolase [Verrucomicrobiota bacterium]|tara:strand:+ start:143 stop:787 length:645 start_codon:yes stop_codon:yes gene_type:complete